MPGTRRSRQASEQAQHGSHVVLVAVVAIELQAKPGAAVRDTKFRRPQPTPAFMQEQERGRLARRRRFEASRLDADIAVQRQFRAIPGQVRPGAQACGKTVA